ESEVVDEMRAIGFAALRVDGDFADHGVGANGEIAGVVGRIDEAGGGIKSGWDVATAFALASAAAVTAAAIFVMLQAVGGHAGAILCQRAPHFGDGVLQGDLGAV